MKKNITGLMVLVLCSCVDVGRVGIHPELKTTYLDASKTSVEACLYSAALQQHLSLSVDSPLPQGTDRYSLQDKDNQVVAWMEIGTFGHDQTSVDFYYAPHAPDIHKAITAMTGQCK
ncbi:TPA: hypothetical protein ACHTOV_004692 [Enterobacter cancerogenus]|uniref:hypothetical protein n=1 Tax=Enterobacter cancerogenus TaxID=69218 RepID=UPI00376B3E4E